MRVLVERRWRERLAMLFLTWFGIHGCNAANWSVANPDAPALMRHANAPTSLSLLWTVGLLWMYRGSLSEIAQQATRRMRGGLGSLRGEKP